MHPKSGAGGRLPEILQTCNFSAAEECFPTDHSQHVPLRCRRVSASEWRACSLSSQLSVLSFTGSRNRYPVSDLKPKKRSGYESQAILGTVIHYIGWTVIFVGTTVIGYFVFDAACAEWTSCFFSFYVFAVLCMFFVIWRAELGARRDNASHLIRTYYRSRTRSMGADEGA